MKSILTGSLACFALLVCSSGVNADGNIRHLTLSQWVCPQESGKLEGQVVLPSLNGSAVAVPNAKVALTSQDGKVVRGSADNNGRFNLNGVKPGIYSMTAKAKDTFACFALHVVDTQAGKGIEFPSKIEVAAAKIDFTLVKTSIIRYLPPKIQKASANLPRSEYSEIASRVCGEQLFRVMKVDGGMSGTIHLAGTRNSDLAAAGLTNVFIVKDGEMFERTVTDENGNFSIDRIPSGEYALLAVGASGIGLAGFELIDEVEVQDTTGNLSSSEAANGDQLVRLFNPQDCCGSFEMQVAPMPEVVTGVVASAPAVSHSAGCCCGCGSVDGGIVMDGGMGTPVDGGMVIGPDGQIMSADGAVIGPDGQIIGGGGLDGGFIDGGMGTPLDGGFVDGGFGTGAPGAGYAPTGGGFGGGLAGGAGAGGGLGAGLAGLAGLGGIIAATTANNDDDDPLPPVSDDVVRTQQLP